MTTTREPNSPNRNQERSGLGPIDGLVALRKVNEGSSQSVQLYETINKPFPLGNANRIAYGGFCISVAIASAYQSLPKDLSSKLNIYSLQGSFLGPTIIEAPVRLEVSSLRETRSFSTKLILVKQDQGQKDKQTGKPIFRSTAAIMIDFVITKGDRTASGMNYSIQPSCRVTDPSDLPTNQERLIQEVKEGRLDEDVMLAVNSTTEDIVKIYEQKTAPEGILWDNLGGIQADRETKQDGRKMTEKASFDWLKPRQIDLTTKNDEHGVLYPPTSRASAACFYGLTLDGYLSFLPLVFSHRFLFDVEACSTLDFSLRFHVDDLRGDLWNLREMKTMSGEDERTYSQSSLWQKVEDRSNDQQDQNEKYKLIATMTQSSIMRGFAKEKSHL